MASKQSIESRKQRRNDLFAIPQRTAQTTPSAQDFTAHEMRTYRNETGATVAFVAALHNRGAILADTIKHTQKPNITVRSTTVKNQELGKNSWTGWTPLGIAAAVNATDAVKALLEKKSTDRNHHTMPNIGLNPLLTAARYGAGGAFTALLQDKKIDPQATDAHLRTAAHWIIASQNTLAIPAVSPDKPRTQIPSLQELHSYGKPINPDTKIAMLEQLMLKDPRALSAKDDEQRTPAALLKNRGNSRLYYRAKALEETPQRALEFARILVQRAAEIYALEQFGTPIKETKLDEAHLEKLAKHLVAKTDLLQILITHESTRLQVVNLCRKNPNQRTIGQNALIDEYAHGLIKANKTLFSSTDKPHDTPKEKTEKEYREYLRTEKNITDEDQIDTIIAQIKEVHSFPEEKETEKTHNIQIDLSHIQKKKPSLKTPHFESLANTLEQCHSTIYAALHHEEVANAIEGKPSDKLKLAAKSPELAAHEAVEQARTEHTSIPPKAITEISRVAAAVAAAAHQSGYKAEAIKKQAKDAAQQARERFEHIKETEDKKTPKPKPDEINKAAVEAIQKLGRELILRYGTKFRTAETIILNEKGNPTGTPTDRIKQAETERLAPLAQNHGPTPIQDNSLTSVQTNNLTPNPKRRAQQDTAYTHNTLMAADAITKQSYPASAKADEYPLQRITNRDLLTLMQHPEIQSRIDETKRDKTKYDAYITLITDDKEPTKFKKGQDKKTVYESLTDAAVGTPIAAAKPPATTPPSPLPAGHRTVKAVLEEVFGKENIETTLKFARALTLRQAARDYLNGQPISRFEMVLLIDELKQTNPIYQNKHERTGISKLLYGKHVPSDKAESFDAAEKTLQEVCNSTEDALTRSQLKARHEHPKDHQASAHTRFRTDLDKLAQKIATQPQAFPAQGMTR